MYPAVKEVHSHEDYTLSIVFENGEKGILIISARVASRGERKIYEEG